MYMKRSFINILIYFDAASELCNNNMWLQFHHFFAPACMQFSLVLVIVSLSIMLVLKGYSCGTFSAEKEIAFEVGVILLLHFPWS